MMCPDCGTDNMAGKLLCYKCGAKLLPDFVGAPQVGGKTRKKKEKRREKRREKRKRYGGFYLLFLLVFLGTIFFFILQKPDIGPLETSPQMAGSLEDKLAGLEKAAATGKAVKVEVSQEELSSLVAKRLGMMGVKEEEMEGIYEIYGRQSVKNIEMEGVQMIFEGSKLKSVITIKIKGKPLYISVIGNVISENGMLNLNPEEMKIGKLPIPSYIARQVMNQVEKKGRIFSLFKVPAGVSNIRIEGGKLIMEVVSKTITNRREATESAASRRELIPTPQEKKRREEIRRNREENKANSWLQVGDNLAGAGKYNLALEYYRKIIDEYPDGEQARIARERIREIEAKLKSE